MKKRIIFIVAMLFACVNISAQNWVSEKIEGDELLGTEEYVTQSFQDCANGYSFSMFDCVSDDFQIYVQSHVFDFNGYGASGGKLVKGIVGLYDETGKLIEKIDKYCFESVGSRYNMIHSNKYSRMGGNNKKNAKKIIDHLRNKSGFVRFVIPLYDDGPFDFKVLCVNDK